MSTREAVLVDALGTLVSLEPPAPRLRRTLSERAGLEVSASEAERAIAAEIAYYRAHLAGGRDAASLADLRLRCAAAMRAALPRPAEQVRLEVLLAALLDALEFRQFPDALPALRAIRARGVRIVVVSNWDVSLADVLARLGLTPLLDGIVTSAEVGASKPAPAIFDQALAIARTSAERALHVGDSVVEDVEGARAAGIEPILLQRNGSPEARGVRTIASLSELDGLLAD